MVNLEILHRRRTAQEVVALLVRAMEFTAGKEKVKWHDIQKQFDVGFEEASVILDWLSDNHKAEPHISNHWIRCGRTYTLNNPYPTMEGMAKALGIGTRRAFCIMMILEERGVISILPDFAFSRKKRMASFSNLAQQMKRVAKKYQGRCELELLVRTLYIDYVTALRLAQYGEETMGLLWRGRSKDLW